jgi:hypothetical protein
LEEIEKDTSSVLYKIKVVRGFENWIIYRKYSEFESLHLKIQKNSFDVNEIAEFPKKTYFSNSTSVIQERIKKFKVYLEYLTSNRSIMYLDFVQEFFQE